MDITNLTEFQNFLGFDQNLHFQSCLVKITDYGRPERNTLQSLTGPEQGFPCVVFPHREKPVFISWDPCNKNFLIDYDVITVIIVLVTTKEKSLGTNFNQQNWMLVIRLLGVRSRWSR